MANNEELSSNNQLMNSTVRKSSLITDSLPIGPMAAASRFMSSLSRQSRNSVREKSIEKSSKKQMLPTRNRSTSPKSPSSAPNLSFTSPFFTKGSTKMHSSLTTPFGLDHISTSPTASTTSMTLEPETVDLNFNFDLTYKYLHELAEINCNYFSQQKTDICRRFERLLIQIVHSLDLSVPLIQYLTENFHHFDYSPEVKKERSIISLFILIILFFCNRFVLVVIEH